MPLQLMRRSGSGGRKTAQRHTGKRQLRGVKGAAKTQYVEYNIPELQKFQENGYGLKIYVDSCDFFERIDQLVETTVTPEFCRKLGTNIPYDGKGSLIHFLKRYKALANYARLWDSSEHQITRYLLVRLKCGQDLVRVNTPDEADLCFPSCDKSCGAASWVPGHGDRKNAAGFCTHQLPFEVPESKQAAFSGCKHIGLFSEGMADDPCQVVIPYYHMALGGGAVRTAALPRDTLMIFAGHSCRGTCRGMEAFETTTSGVSLAQKFSVEHSLGWDRRGVVLHEMQEYAREVDPENKERLISEVSLKATDREAGKIGPNPEFLSLAWDMYARSKFSFQPQGDTPTRRAFYDGWLFGAIPVVTNQSAAIYRRLMSSFIFKKVAFEDIFVVFPDNASGKEILDRLRDFSDEEIEQRRAHLMGLRRYIMWDWGRKPDRELCYPQLSKKTGKPWVPRFCREGISEYDALLMGLGALRTDI